MESNRKNFWGFYSISGFVDAVVMALVANWLHILDSISMNMKVTLQQPAGVMS